MHTLYPPPGSPSDPPTWEDIERLALHYPAAQHAVSHVRRGELTREQALISLVFWLAGEYARFFEAEVQRLRLEPARPSRAKE